jgi:hypothetical protein
MVACRRRNSMERRAMLNKSCFGRTCHQSFSQAHSPWPAGSNGKPRQKCRRKAAANSAVDRRRNLAPRAGLAWRIREFFHLAAVPLRCLRMLNITSGEEDRGRARAGVSFATPPIAFLSFLEAIKLPRQKIVNLVRYHAWQVVRQIELPEILSHPPQRASESFRMTANPRLVFHSDPPSEA